MNTSEKKEEDTDKGKEKDNQSDKKLQALSKKIEGFEKLNGDLENKIGKIGEELGGKIESLTDQEVKEL